MAVPSRVFVGLTVFGLACSVLSVAAVVLTFTCQEVDEGPGIDIGQAKCRSISGGTKLFLAMACLFCIAFTVLAWRSLLAGARRDRERRARGPGGGVRAAPAALDAKRDAQAGSQAPDSPPPGYQ